jgi:hypothetical protein
MGSLEGETSDDNMIGGTSPAMGNLIDGNGGLSNFQARGLPSGGITIGVAGKPQFDRLSKPGSGTVIEHNTIVDNGSDGGVVVYGGFGNHIVDNVMYGNTVQINLGGGHYRSNRARQPE